MADLLSFEPNNVLSFFQQINQIPRESGNEKEISDFLVAFAKERGLFVYQDASLNVLIRKPATPGFENKKGIILQGHMDMVCEKNQDTQHDFSKDPIDMYVDGDKIRARGTTLGADNGIAVAMGLALLDSQDVDHPFLELLITTDEEVGMTGAIHFDVNLLQGSYFINLDSEEEGEFVVSCAGGLKSFINLPLVKEEISIKDMMLKEISIRKLVGGHSGVEIDKGRANALKLAGRVLSALDEKLNFYLVDLYGGRKDNVICREAFFTIAIKKEDEDFFDATMDLVCAEIKNEYRSSDPDIEIVSETMQNEEEITSSIEVILDDTLEKIIFILLCTPNGIQTMSAELAGFVESSLNIGKVAIEDEHMVFLYAIRSSVRSLKYHITHQLELFAKMCKAEFIQTAQYPEWPLVKDSHLVDVAKQVYREVSGKEAIIKSLHAGVEPGVFLEKRHDIEAISLGPDMQGVHSPDEWVSISSIQRTYSYLLKLIERL